MASTSPHPPVQVPLTITEPRMRRTEPLKTSNSWNLWLARELVDSSLPLKSFLTVPRPRKRKRSRRDTTIQATTSSCHVEIRQMEKEQTAKASPAVAVSRDTGLVPSTRRIAHANVDPLNTAATTTHESADAGSPAHYAADVNSEVCNVATGSSEMPMVIDTQDHA